MEEFLKDLQQWRYLYVAGRMHKPVLHMFQPTGSILKFIHLNYSHALHTALLCLPRNFSAIDLLKEIVAISYRGDLRMAFAEDPQKIHRIVGGQYELLWNIYHPLLTDLSTTDASRTRFTQDVSPFARLSLISKLPMNLYRRLSRQLDPFELVKRPDESFIPKTIHGLLASIVHRPAIIQPVKGLFTTGITKSFFYSLHKLKRRFL